MYHIEGQCQIKKKKNSYRVRVGRIISRKYIFLIVSKSKPNFNVCEKKLNKTFKKLTHLTIF